MCITTKDVFAWGSNEYGQLGHGDAAPDVCSRPFPIKVLHDIMVTQVSSSSSSRQAGAGGVGRGLQNRTCRAHGAALGQADCVWTQTWRVMGLGGSKGISGSWHAVVEQQMLLCWPLRTCIRRDGACHVLRCALLCCACRWFVGGCTPSV